MTTSTRFNLKFFTRVLKRRHPGKLLFSLFSPKKSVRLIKQKDVKPSPDSKMIKLLTFENLFPPLRHSH